MPDGIDERQTVKLEHKYEAENYIWNRKPLWGYVDEADPKVMEMQIEEATKYVVKDYHISYSPHVSIGWDNNPRFQKFRPDIVKNNTPENFEKALQAVKAFADEHCDLPLITVNSWNEWTETSYLEPDNLNSYGYLEAIKSVFGKKQGR